MPAKMQRLVLVRGFSEFLGHFSIPQLACGHHAGGGGAAPARPPTVLYPLSVRLLTIYSICGSGGAGVGVLVGLQLPATSWSTGGGGGAPSPPFAPCRPPLLVRSGALELLVQGLGRRHPAHCLRPRDVEFSSRGWSSTERREGVARREARRGGGRERRVRNFVDEKLVVAA